MSQSPFKDIKQEKKLGNSSKDIEPSNQNSINSREPERSANTNGSETPTKKRRPSIKSESESSDSESSDSSDSESSDSDSESSDSDSASSDSDSSSPEVPIKKKPFQKSKPDTTKTKKKIVVTTKTKTEEKKGQIVEEKVKKTKRKTETEEHVIDEWWNDQDQLPEGIHWKTLEHKGPLFPPPYQPHKVPLYYDKTRVELTPVQEEAATFYAYYLETDHVTKEVFRQNFWHDFKDLLKRTHHPDVAKFKELSKFDFTHIHKHLVEQREIKKNRSKEEKDEEKKKKQEIKDQYGYALLDGRKEKIGNFVVEPPGLFLGRGSHPKAGKIKTRIEPKDVTINISKGAKPPKPPIQGTEWKEIVHKPEVTWLAFWKENIQNNFKYVWLAPSSRVKGQADMKKFEVARGLHQVIDKIRDRYTKGFKSDDKKENQLAVALYFIDRLALRVGNEKDDETADTVGCCSLRVEHIQLKEPNIVEFDFLGKDSMRYQNSVAVEPIVFKTVKEFIKGKRPGNDLFDQISAPVLNEYLKGNMAGLTAKVFRTYNASITLQRELEKTPPHFESQSVEEKLLFYNRCNREVAILCNHQRSLPKKHGEQMGKIDEKLEELKKELALLERHRAILTGKGTKGKKTSTPKKEDQGEPDLKTSNKRKRPQKDEDEDEDEEDEKHLVKKKVKTETETKKETTKINKATGEKKTTKEIKKVKKEEEAEEETEEEKMKKLPTDLEKVDKMIERIKERIGKWNIKKTEKDELKTVALGTSKINYLDPRITAAWAKRYNVPIERLFSKALREKFPWALGVDPDYQFINPSEKKKENQQKETTEQKNDKKVKTPQKKVEPKDEKPDRRKSGEKSAEESKERRNSTTPAKKTTTPAKKTTTSAKKTTTKSPAKRKKTPRKKGSDDDSDDDSDATFR